jgi:HAD superfamily hydrolase (TIGR01458 family)
MAPPPPRLRAVLIDLEGTLFQAGTLIPGAARALEAVSNRGISVGFVTNTTSRPRSTLVTELSAMGLEVPPDRILTAAIAARAYLLSRQLSRCHFLTRRELLEDFAGIETDDEAPMAIVQGDLPDELLAPALHRALRFLFDGAELITLARNRYFRGPEGLLLDVGAWTAALEYGCRRQASLAGKPARGFFDTALEMVGASAAETAVVGDDLESDVGGAQAAGMRGVLVRTGKFLPEELARSAVRPDAVLDSIADLPALLGS